VEASEGNALRDEASPSRGNFFRAFTVLPFATARRDGVR